MLFFFAGTGVMNTSRYWQLRDDACIVGSSDFGFFHILRCNNPSLTPQGPKDLEIGKKNIQLHPWLAKIFGKPESAFFCIISNLNFRNPV
jgi:hypothetical protein